MNSGMYMGVKLLEHAMKIAEEVLVKSLRKFLTMDDMQFGFMPGKGTIDAVFILRRIHEEYFAMQKNLYMCFFIWKGHLTEFQGKLWNGQ